MNIQVGIVGAGLAGLACAIELEKQGVDVTVFEKGDHVGGRIQTENFEGFKLDHGFQIYLPSYSMGSYFLDHKSLNLKSFKPGACLKLGKGLKVLSDPFRNPLGIISTLLNPATTIKDKFLILKLRSKAIKSAQIDPRLNSLSTLSFLENFGFSQTIIEHFFKPFFAGVFLEKELKTPAGFFLYLFGRFSAGDASLPFNGMQSIAFQMQNKLKKKILFGHKVKGVTSKEIQFHNDNIYSFDRVVMATDVSALSDLGFAANDTWNCVTTLYFKTKSVQFADRYLVLNPDSRMLVNHVACLSAVQPSYAPKEWHLYSVNCVGSDLTAAEALPKVKAELEVIFGKEEIETWMHVKSYFIKKALPSVTSFGNSAVGRDGIFYVGDYLESPSIQGALLSGFKAADAILSLLQKN